MEQTDTCKRHRHFVFIARRDHILIPDRAARLRDILHTALVRPLNVVAEREERIGAEGHILSADRAMRASPLSVNTSGFSGKYFLPCAVCEYIHMIRRRYKRSIALSRSARADVIRKRKCHDLRSTDEGTSCPPSVLPGACSEHGTAVLRRYRSPVRP